MKTISIITPIYHGEKYISNLYQMCIENVLNTDDHVIIELVISNDDPQSEIEVSSDNERLRIVCINTTVNGGIQEARIRGFCKSSGDYVVFLDQDDKIAENYVYSQLSHIGEADAVVCQIIHDNKVYYSSDEAFRKQISRKCMIGEGNGIVSPGQVLIKRDSVPALWLDNRLKRTGADDYLLWLGMFGENRVFAANDDTLFEHVMTTENTSLKVGEMFFSTIETLDLAIYEGGFDDIGIDLLKELKEKYSDNFSDVSTKNFNMVYLLERMVESPVFADNLAMLIKQSDGVDISIYGAGLLGRILNSEMCRYCNNVKCYIDRNALNIRANLPVFLPDEVGDSIGLIIIATVSGQDQIRVEMNSRYPNKKVVLLNELLSE